MVESFAVLEVVTVRSVKSVLAAIQSVKRLLLLKSLKVNACSLKRLFKIERSYLKIKENIRNYLSAL